jgi:hypothetical protein
MFCMQDDHTIASSHVWSLCLDKYVKPIVYKLISVLHKPDETPIFGILHERNAQFPHFVKNCQKLVHSVMDDGLYEHNHLLRSALPDRSLLTNKLGYIKEWQSI